VLLASLRDSRLALDLRACTRDQETREPGVSRRPIRFGELTGFMRGLFFLALPSSRTSDTSVAFPFAPLYFRKKWCFRDCRDRFANPSVTMRFALRSEMPFINRRHPRSCADRHRSRCGHVRCSATTRPSAPLHSPSLRGASALAHDDMLDPRLRSTPFLVKEMTSASLGPTPPTDFCSFIYDARAHLNERPILTARKYPDRPSAGAFYAFALSFPCVLFRARTACTATLCLRAAGSESHETISSRLFDAASTSQRRIPKVIALRYAACGRRTDPVVTCGDGWLKR